MINESIDLIKLAFFFSSFFIEKDLSSFFIEKALLTHSAKCTSFITYFDNNLYLFKVYIQVIL